MDSILTSIKNLLGITESCTDFDGQIIIYINSVFMALKQMGIGPSAGFSIDDKNDEWEDFTDGDLDLEPVKTYVYLKVRLLFDPPSSSAVTDSINRAIDEIEWRINNI